MTLLRHFSRLFKELFYFARTNKAWWIIPLVVVLLLVTLIIVTSSSVAPFIYPLF